jgi:hypothetical protein
MLESRINAREAGEKRSDGRPSHTYFSGDDLQVRVV